MSGFGSFGYSGSNEPNDGYRDKWHLASEASTPETVLLQLATESDASVATAVAQNYAASPKVLLEVVRHHPELEELVALNRNAPVELKDTSPLSEHTEDSLSKYLDDRMATQEQRTKLSKVYRSLRPPGGPTVGEVWNRLNS